MNRNGYMINTITVFALSIVLFYLPSVIFFFERGKGHAAEHSLAMIMATFYTGTFLLNYFYLVPRLLIKTNQLSLYLLINLCLMVGVMLFMPFVVETQGWLEYGPRRCPHTSFMRNALIHAGFSLRDGIMMLLASALGYALRIGKEKQDLRSQELELRVVRRQIELQSLKAQLNPHFLFNSLNNIYALISFAPDRAQSALHDFSNMLRFMIYEADSPYVELDREIRFIQEYVKLMRLRLGSSCKIVYDPPVDLPAGLRIAPLLYMTIVENAFKHASATSDGYYIIFTLYVEEGKGRDGKDTLVFRVENSWSEREDKEIDGEHSGVGLKNVERQLNILYAGESSFIIEKSTNRYSAEIRISIEALERTHDNNKT